MSGPDSDDLKARLLKPRLQEDSVEIPGIGTVRVRGLSRGEVFAIQNVAKSTEDMERKTLARALVDPVMTEDEVRTWQEISPAGEMEEISDRVKALSGLGAGADKSGVPAVRDETGDGVRTLPGREAVDDGGPTAGADEQ